MDGTGQTAQTNRQTQQLDGDTHELPALHDTAAATDATEAKAAAEALLAEPPAARDVSAEL
ncbi:MAG: hypothetical protein HOV68_30785, partial [Streptomycetaceae bacterium]|nr:hypothetical protein [Streptomycetaceae bacterium]